MFCVYDQNVTMIVCNIESKYCRNCWNNIIPSLKEEMCSICLEKANDSSITQCSHVFCKNCLIDWINTFYKLEIPITLYPCQMCLKIFHHRIK